ncbi:lipoprotein [Mycoplasmatota bacterium WC44]
MKKIINLLLLLFLLTGCNDGYEKYDECTIIYRVVNDGRISKITETTVNDIKFKENETTYFILHNGEDNPQRFLKETKIFEFGLVIVNLVEVECVK